MSEARGSRSGSLGRNALANVAGRGVSALLWVVVTPFVLARLGQERYAVWALFFVLGGQVGSLDMGMSSGVTRFAALATARGERRNLLLVLWRSLLLSLGFGLLWCVVCIAFRGPLIHAIHVPAALEPEVGRSLIVFALSMVTFSVTQVLNGTLVGFQRLDLSNLCFLLGLLLHATVLVAGLALGAGLMAAAVAPICGHVLSGVVSGYFVRRSVRAMPDRDVQEPVSWREMLRFGGAIQATVTTTIGQLQAGRVLLGVLGQLAWVTRFDLGFRVANAIYSLPTLMQGAIIPAAAHASADERGGQVRVVYDWSSRWLLSLAGYTLAGLWLVAPALITVWLGPGHGESVAVTRILAIAFAIATIPGPATAVARGGGWPMLEAWNFTIAVILNVLICLWAVPRYGPVGAAVAMAVSYALAGAWMIATMHRILGVSTGVWLLKVALPRLLLPGAAAALLWWLWPGPEPAGRLEALRSLALHGTAFMLLALALAWPTGDPAVLIKHLRRARGGASRSQPIPGAPS